MSFLTRLKRLLGLRRRHPPKIGKGTWPSLLSVAVQVKQEVQTAICGVCEKTFPMVPFATYVNPRSDGFIVDVGGYCYNCREHHCGDGSTLICENPEEDTIAKRWLLACAHCGLAYSEGHKRMMETVDKVVNFLMAGLNEQQQQGGS